MQQYLDLLKAIVFDGTFKPAAREGMPETYSLFGYQFRHNLGRGFPLLTTKKMFWKGVVIELLWFLKGDINIRYLVQNDVNIWNEDAYNYYKKLCSMQGQDPLSFKSFVRYIKTATDYEFANDRWFYGSDINYKLGDLPNQYGEVWRSWNTGENVVLGQVVSENGVYQEYGRKVIDQITNLIKSLKETPESRRHIVTSINPAVEPALYWCHAMMQFNCRKVEYFEGDGVTHGEQGKFYRWVVRETRYHQLDYHWEPVDATSKEEIMNSDKYPKYYLDCQLYQRSADVFLGVPFNIASYALLTHMIAKVCNMYPGDFIHSFGDVHIYKNHVEAIKTQLVREPHKLPTLNITAELNDLDISTCESLKYEDFQLHNYTSHPKIDAELSTGLKKK